MTETFPENTEKKEGIANLEPRQPISFVYAS
jgi:hypothetical protein